TPGMPRLCPCSSCRVGKTLTAASHLARVVLAILPTRIGVGTARRRSAPLPALRSITRREVARKLPCEIWEIARDQSHVELPEDRLLRLAVEQESERRLDAALRRMRAAGEFIARFARHRDVVVGLAGSVADDHRECERITVGRLPDLDHVDLL